MINGPLRRSRPALDWIAERYPRPAETLGVGLPFRPGTGGSSLAVLRLAA